MCLFIQTGLTAGLLNNQSSPVSEERRWAVGGFRLRVRSSSVCGTVHGRWFLSHTHTPRSPCPFYFFLSLQKSRSVRWTGCGVRSQRSWEVSEDFEAAKHTLRQHQYTRFISETSLKSVKKSQRTGPHQSRLGSECDHVQANKQRKTTHVHWEGQ